MFQRLCLGTKGVIKCATILGSSTSRGGLLLFAVLQVIVRYKIKFENGANDIPLERNKLVEMVVGEYEKMFYQKWTGRLNVMYL